jgi:two-component system phosphate regulon response regulator OmpR
LAGQRVNAEMSAKAKIAVVDDEPDLRETIREYLEAHDFDVTTFDGAAGLRSHIAVPHTEVDLAILDISMPGEDGLSLARHLREHSDISIIIVTGAGDVIDRVVGLETGADDYVTKPVDLRELLARVRAVLRRATGTAQANTARGDSEIHVVRFGDYWLDLKAHKLRNDDGEEVKLTSMEFDLLKAFAEHPDRVLSRDQLLEMAHNRNWDPFDRSIDIRIARIRQKIERDPKTPQLIKTVRGVGYVFSPSSATS